MSVQDAYAPPRAVVRDVSGGSGLMSDRILAALRKTRPWVLLISILGFIGAAFTAVASVFIFLGGGMMSANNLEAAGYPATMMLGIGLMYLLAAAIAFMVSLYLLRYANAIKRAVIGLNVSEMEAALEAQASFWKLVGILALIYIVLIIGFMVVGLGGMIMMGSNIQ